VIPGAIAAGYPDRPVRWVVPSTAGGGTDAATRIIAPKLADYLGQQIVIENRPGASGNIGAEYVARAAPDGYTLLTCIASHASNAALKKKIPFDLARDFAPVSLLVTVPEMIIAHPALPAIDDGAEATASSSPEEFGALIRSELVKWAKVVKDAGITPE